MTVYDQQVTSYSDTTPHVRVVGDLIHLIDPTDAPLVMRLGLDSARSKFRLGLNGYKVEILEDAHDPLSDTANQGTTITTSTLTITVTDASIFQDGHVIKIDSEYMVVKTPNTTSNTILVYSRAYGGTNATHAATSTVEIVGMARLEGDDADYGPIVDIAAPYNYTSIFQKGLNVSGTQQVISQYGIDDEFLYQANKAVPGLMRLVEKSVFHGVRAAGSASAPRSMGGLGTFITGNSQSITTSITKAAVDNLAELVYADGGNPDILVMNQAGANNLRALLDSSSFVRVGQENTVFGMRPVMRVNTQFYGDLEIVVSRWCPPTKAYMLDSSKVGLYSLRPFARHEIARSGDSVKGEVIGEFSLMVANDSAHGWIQTSASEL